MSKKVLFASNNHWESPFQVGTHEIARQYLADGWEIAYVSDPISPLHILSKEKEILKDRFKNWKNGGIQHSNSLWAYVPFSLISPVHVPILDSNYVLKNWFRYSLPHCINKIKNKNFQFVDVLSIDSVYQSFWLDKINYRKSVFRIADDNSGFTRYNNNIRKIEEEIISKVDLVLYSALTLKSKIEKLNPKKSIYLPNGVNYNHFNKFEEKFPSEFEKIPEPRLLYIGAIDYWFDFDLINYAAKILPQFSFVLIGNTNVTSDFINEQKNVFLLGTKPYSEIPNYIHFADAGIIPFSRDKYPQLVDSINPLKLLQYSAGGLPTISVSWPQLRLMNSPAILYQTKAEFIEYVVQRKYEDVDRNELKNYAKENDWKYRYNRIIENLEMNQ